MRIIKYLTAKIWMKHLMRTVKPEDLNENYQQKWTHLQGQILTRGRMKWNWKKLLKKKTE